MEVMCVSCLDIRGDPGCDGRGQMDRSWFEAEAKKHGVVYEVYEAVGEEILSGTVRCSGCQKAEIRMDETSDFRGTSKCPDRFPPKCNDCQSSKVLGRLIV